MRAALFFAFLSVSPVAFGIARAAVATKECTSTPTSCTLNFGSTIASGNALAVFVAEYQQTQALLKLPTGVTTTAGGTFIQLPLVPSWSIPNSNSAQNFQGQWYYMCSTGGGGGTGITATFPSGGAAFVFMAAERVSGAASSGCLDEYRSNFTAGQGNGTLDSRYANTATQNASEILIGVGMSYPGVTFTAGNDGQGGSYSMGSSLNWIAIEDEVVSSINTYKATISQNVNTPWLAAFLSFSASSVTTPTQYYVQGAFTECGSSPTSCTATFQNAIGAGHIVEVAGLAYQGTTTNSMTSSSYTAEARQDSLFSGQNLSLNIFYTCSDVGGGTTASISYPSGAASFLMIAAVELQSLSTANCLDRSVFNNSITGAADAGTPDSGFACITRRANEVLLGINANFGGFISCATSSCVDGQGRTYAMVMGGPWLGFTEITEPSTNTYKAAVDRDIQSNWIQAMNAFSPSSVTGGGCSAAVRKASQIF